MCLGQSGLQIKFQDSQDCYMEKSCLEKQLKQQKNVSILSIKNIVSENSDLTKCEGKSHYQWTGKYCHLFKTGETYRFLIHNSLSLKKPLKTF